MSALTKCPIPVDKLLPYRQNVPDWLRALYVEVKTRNYTGSVILHISQGRVGRIEKRTSEAVDDSGDQQQT